MAVEVGGAAIELAGARLRTLLARLAIDNGRPVSRAALVDAVWPESPPAGAANALQALVARLRRVLPPDVLDSPPAGYRLHCTVDIDEFGRLCGSADRTDLIRALDLWRGDPFADVDGAFAAVAARLTELRLRVARHRDPAGPGPAGHAGRSGWRRQDPARDRGRRAWSASGEVRLVELAPVREPAEVPAAALSALGVVETTLLRPGSDPTVRLVTALGQRSVLLVLDSCEHQLDACAALVDAVLAGCPNVRILTTTREPLALTGRCCAPPGRCRYHRPQ